MNCPSPGQDDDGSTLVVGLDLVDDLVVGVRDGDPSTGHRLVVVAIAGALPVDDQHVDLALGARLLLGARRGRRARARPRRPAAARPARDGYDGPTPRWRDVTASGVAARLRLAVQPDGAEHLAEGGHHPGVEGPELGVERRGLVEPHRVDDLLEVVGVHGEERDAPLEVVDARWSP